jgi:hypothetical protein
VSAYAALPIRARFVSLRGGTTADNPPHRLVVTYSRTCNRLRSVGVATAPPGTGNVIGGLTSDHLDIAWQATLSHGDESFTSKLHLCPQALRAQTRAQNRASDASKLKPAALCMVHGTILEHRLHATHVYDCTPPGTLSKKSVKYEQRIGSVVQEYDLTPVVRTCLCL